MEHTIVVSPLTLYIAVLTIVYVLDSLDTYKT